MLSQKAITAILRDADDSIAWASAELINHALGCRLKNVSAEDADVILKLARPTPARVAAALHAKACLQAQFNVEIEAINAFYRHSFESFYGRAC